MIDWLDDECRRRDITYVHMASDLGFTPGYFTQLSNGQRKISETSPKFTMACARFLCVEPIVIKLACGQIEISDFVKPSEPEEVSIERSIRRLQEDPVFRGISLDMATLSIEAKKELLMKYAQTATTDVLGLSELPNVLQRLQRVTVHLMGR